MTKHRQPFRKLPPKGYQFEPKPRPVNEELVNQFLQSGGTIKRLELEMPRKDNSYAWGQRVPVMSPEYGH